MSSMKSKFLQGALLLATLLFAASAQATTYTSVSAGAWTTTTNWSPAGTPGPNDDVIIDHAMTMAGGIYDGSGSVTIRNSGSLTLSGNTTIGGVNSSGLMDFVVQNTATLTINGLVTLDDFGVLTMTAGTGTVQSMSVAGGSYVGNGGTMTVSTSGLTITSAGGSSFSNNSGATFIVNTGTNTGVVSAAKFTNAGTFSVINTAGDFTFANSGGTFSNTGTLNVAGAFTANATITNAGTLSAATFTMQNSGGTFTNTGTVTVSGVTTVIGATMQLSPSSTGSSRMTVRGVLNMQGGGFTVGNGLPGTPAKYADLVIEASLGESGGTITVQCNGRVAIFSDFNISSGNFTIQNCSSGVGGQVYVDGDGTGASVTRTGGAITNNNAPVGGVPYGFYVNGSSSGTVPAAGTVAQMQANNPSFANWVSSLPNSPLPVKLQYFDVASVTENGISLEWATSMEKNFSHFDVERAGADLAFSNIGVVQGAGGLAVKTVYTFLDDSPVNGKNYYRLKAVDFDGSSEYFNVIAADWSGTDDARVYPNPAIENTFTIDIGDQYNESVNVVVYEARGYAVYSSDVTSKTTTVRLPENISAGVYMVRLSSPSKQQVIRLIVN
jgi:hypothetical protein